MPKVKVNGGRIKGIQDLNNKLAASGSGYIKNLKGGEELRVRFLEEPGEWLFVNQHYVGGTEAPYRWCTAPDCIPCDNGVVASTRYISNCVDVEAGKVILLQMPDSLCKKVKMGFERRGTIKDRDYIVTRVGSNKNDTRYDAEPQDREKIDLSKFKLIDSEKVVEADANRNAAEDDLADDDKPKRNTSKNSSSKKADDYEDADDDDDAKPAKKAKKNKADMSGLNEFKPKKDKTNEAVSAKPAKKSTAIRRAK